MYKYNYQRAPPIPASSPRNGAESQYRPSDAEYGSPDAYATAAIDAGRATNVAGRPHGCSKDDGGFVGGCWRYADSNCHS